MSEWIKRSEQEPPRDGTWFLAMTTAGVPMALRWRESAWRDSEGFIPHGWLMWSKIDFPPRTVTIEISEKAARKYAAISEEMWLSDIDNEFVMACRRALEEQR